MKKEGEDETSSITKVYIEKRRELEACINIIFYIYFFFLLFDNRHASIIVVQTTVENSRTLLDEVRESASYTAKTIIYWFYMSGDR